MTLRSDLRAPNEFATIGVTIADNPSFVGSMEQTGPAPSSALLRSGADIGLFEGLDDGAWWIAVRLVDVSGRLLIERVINTVLDGNRSVRTMITRSCLGVLCPAGTDVLATECLNGECVRPDCDPDDPRTCGDAVCSLATDCGPAGSGCAETECLGGGCFERPDDALCAPGQTCDLASGCVGEPACAGFETQCGNGLDDDCDGDVDCLDSDCISALACEPTCDVTETECGDGLDDDCDGDVDCADSDCASVTSCIPTCDSGCDDSDPCTADTCDAGACRHDPMAGTLCDDGNVCTAGDVCDAAGACAGAPASGACDDGLFCTLTDVCMAGACVGSGARCDDGLSCTADTCTEATRSCTSASNAGCAAADPDASMWCGPGAEPSVPVNHQCPAGNAREGCPCPSAGASAACFTGAREDRGSGQCRDGMAMCAPDASLGGALRWGSCGGERLPTAGADYGAEACSCMETLRWNTGEVPTWCVGSPPVPKHVFSRNAAQGCPDWDFDGELTGPHRPWVDGGTLSVDCPGEYEVCLEMRAGRDTAAGCLMGRSCVELSHPGGDLAVGMMPAFIGRNIACNERTFLEGAHVRYRVRGTDSRCDPISSGRMTIGAATFLADTCSDGNPGNNGSADCSGGTSSVPFDGSIDF